ncbi:MAG: DUF4249 domain-containing protein [Chitinophagales bacterium]|nr:DUF4249 domain-containing protein [Chitinophagales bacterium]
MIKIKNTDILKYWSFVLFAMVVFVSCEEPFTPDTSLYEPQIVVEGYVETGIGSLPAYVFLTKSIPFIASIDGQDFGDLFVKNAEVSVFDGDQTVQFTALCLQDLPDDIKKKAGELLGINTDSLQSNICVYIDLADQLIRAEGRRYDLTVKVDDQILTATTTLPSGVDLYDFKWVEPAGLAIDTMAELRVMVEDPAEEANFYRYLTATERDRQFIPPPFGSVIDDAIFNGKAFEIPLQRAQRRNGDFDPDTFGLYVRGDSAYIKWCTIDKAHFDFWNTRDYAAANSGSFSSYTRVTSNIQGGLGIWGGYTVRVYRLYCPPK